MQHNMQKPSRLPFTLLIAIAVALGAQHLIADTATPTTRSHAIAMYGEPKYPVGFTHFDYTSDKAVRGGTLALGSQGNFDSLNPYIPKGNPADKLGLVYDTLMEQSADEAFSQYGLVAEQVEWPQDRSWVRYYLNPKARFNDGHEVTADDVVFSFNLLMEKGAPTYQAYYSDVVGAKAEGKYQVLFTFRPGIVNRELVMITGQLPVLPKHYWEKHDFSVANLDFPLGSGPYRVAKIDAGRRVVFERVDNYWGKDLPVKRNMYNFEKIRVDYYRDATVLLEALKAGEYDFRYENVSKQWFTGYNSSALQKGLLVKREVPHEIPQGMQAFVINMRKPLFQDIRVRKALNLAYDFEWANKQLFYGAYTRTQSYFSNSELASSGLPSGRELEILEPFRKQLPESVFAAPFALPVTDGSGNNRVQLREAKQLLEAAGWKIVNNHLVNAKGEPFKFEILVYDTSFERVMNPYVKHLQRLGIEASIRRVEIAQFVNRMREFDYDMMIGGFGQSVSPGNEQLEYWHSSRADMKASRNYIGIKDPVVDKLTELLIAAPDREELIIRSHALDRVLLNYYFVIPNWHVRSHRIAYWNKFGMPDTPPRYDLQYGTGLMTWWIDGEKQKAVDAGKSMLKQ
jgi:microcin C transport system substrate-binding protein